MGNPMDDALVYAKGLPKDSRYICNLNGHPAFIAKSKDEHTHSVTLVIYEVGAWTIDDEVDFMEEVAVYFVKWDGCAHIGFRSPDLGNEWVHVCGVANMHRVLLMMTWAWNLAVTILREHGHTDHDLEIIHV